MKRYKVFDKGLTSPFKNFKYQKSKWYTCDNFDEDENNDCSYGFYATNFEGVLYSWNCNDKEIWEVEVKGNKVEIDQYKMRYEKIKIIRKLSKKEILDLAVKVDKKVKFKFSEILYPFNPLTGKSKKANKKDIDNLKKWISVRDSVRDSVWDSVRDSVRDSVGDSVRASVWISVRDSVRDSVGDSVEYSVWDSVEYSVWDSVWASVGVFVRAFISYYFHNIKKWKYINHEKGINPFQPCIDLWFRGFVPSFDGKIWRLHSGKYATVVYEWVK